MTLAHIRRDVRRIGARIPLDPDLLTGSAQALPAHEAGHRIAWAA